ncbi:MAG: SH3 domain-containing protein [Oscillospiraceae bacterium]|nr:SH3 domain-containing protein [Oscillospiraceae bacterium]
MKKSLCGVLAMLLLVCLSLPGMAMAEGYWQLAAIDGQGSDRVHLRAEPSKDADSMGLYFAGTYVEVLDERTADWVWVRIGEETGYIMRQYLQFTMQFDMLARTASQQPLGLANNLGGAFVNLRPAPVEAGQPLLGVGNGALVTIAGETDDHWYYVRDEMSGQWGYMLASLVLPVDAGTYGTYREVLERDGYFRNPEDNSLLRLSDLRNGSEGMPLSTTAFSRIDLNGDGQIEIVVQLEASFGVYGVLVLHQSDHTVYGQTFGLRALDGLKLDGSYSFSSSAAESGIGRLQFVGAQCIQTEITYSELVSDEDPVQIAYYVDNKPSSRAGFEAAIKRWTELRDAVWVRMP